MTPTDPDWDDHGIVSLFIGTFAARDDLYVENGAEVKRQRLSPNVVRDAIAHRYAVSGYLGTEDGRTHVGAIDFDTDDGLEQARQVQHLLDQHSIPSLVVGSRRGAHLWVTCLDWSDTLTMHRALKGAVALSAGPDAAKDPKVEVFPKRGDGLACGALRMPGLPHQRTQQVYPLYFGATVVSAPTFRQIIEMHALTMAEAISRFAGKAPALREYPKSLGNFYGYSPQYAHFSEAPKASEVLSAWGVQCRPGATVQCPMHDDHRRSLTVFKDDERVFCGAPHCVLNGGGHGVGSIHLKEMRPQ